MKNKPLLTFLIFQIAAFFICTISLIILVFIMYKSRAVDIIFFYNMNVKVLFFIAFLFYITMFTFSSVTLYKIYKKEESIIRDNYFNKLYKSYDGIIEVEDIIMRIYTLLNVGDVFVDMDIKSLPKTVRSDKVLLRRVFEIIGTNYIRENHKKISVKIYTKDGYIVFEFFPKLEHFYDYESIYYILKTIEGKITISDKSIMISKKI